MHVSRLRLLDQKGSHPEETHSSGSLEDQNDLIEVTMSLIIAHVVQLLIADDLVTAFFSIVFPQKM